MPLHRGKMAAEFVVATEKYGSGSRERKYRFSTESGNIERIGRKRDSAATSVQQFFKVCQLCWPRNYKGGPSTLKPLVPIDLRLRANLMQILE